LLQDLRYFRVAFRPISLQGDHISLQKFLSYLRRIDGEALVGFAGDTPIGGEVDEDRLAGCERLVERRFAEGPPNQLTRLSDESIRSSRQQEHEDHRDDRQGTRTRGGNRRPEGSFDPCEDRDHKKNRSQVEERVHALHLAQDPHQPKQGGCQ
jgi:hypothetical protein